MNCKIHFCFGVLESNMLLFLYFGRHLALALIVLVFSTSCHRVSLAPPYEKNGRQTRQLPQAALIVVTGFDPQRYVPIANKVQKALSAVDLWVSVVDTSEDIRSVQTMFHRDGLPRATPVFLLGIYI
jgi:hypothetical protein